MNFIKRNKTEWAAAEQNKAEHNSIQFNSLCESSVYFQRQRQRNCWRVNTSDFYRKSTHKAKYEKYLEKYTFAKHKATNRQILYTIWSSNCALIRRWLHIKIGIRMENRK